MDILGISRFAALDLRSPKVTANLKSYLQKYLFSLKQTKKNQLLSATLEKIIFCLFKKRVYGSLRHRQGITMEICKTEATQAGLGIFWHILTNSGTRRHIQEVFGHIQAYLQPFVTPAYLEPWYIHLIVEVFK